MNQQQMVVANNGYNPLPSFQQNKLAWEDAIASYVGDDPLELWYNYIYWYEQNVQLDTENAFEAILGKCLSMYEYEEVFKQDQRMVKLWMKYIDLKPNALNLYQLLYQRDVGTKCTIFYIGWARYFESAGALKQAESVFNLGFQVNAQPSDELKAAHTKFRLTFAQSILFDNTAAQQTATAAATTTSTASSAKKRNADQMTGASEPMQPHELPEAQPYDNQQQQYAHPSSQPNYQQQHPHQQEPLEPEQPLQQQQSTSLPVAAAAEHPDPAVQHEQYDQHSHMKRQRTHHHHQHPHHQQHHHNHHEHHSSGHSQPHGHEAPTNSEPVHSYHDQPPQNQHQQHETHQYAGQTTTADGDAATTTATASTAQQPSDVRNDANAVAVDSQPDVYAADAAISAAEPRDHTDDGLPGRIVLDANHCSHFRNAADDEWQVPLCMEEPFEPNKCCRYPKELVYPVGADGSAARYEYSPEEIRARRWSGRLATLRDQRQLEQQRARDAQLAEQQRELERQRQQLELEARQRAEHERLRAAAEHERLRIAEQERVRQAEYQRRAADVAERKQRMEQTQPQQQSYQQYYNLNGYQAQPAQHHHQQQQYHHNNTTTTTTTTSVIRTVGNDSVEETFEESTIRFSTGNGHSRPKTITIKFRKEPPALPAPEHPATNGAVPFPDGVDSVAATSDTTAVPPTPVKPKKEKKSKLAKRLLNGQHTSKAAATAAAATEAAAATQKLHTAATEVLQPQTQQLQQLEHCHLLQQQQQQLLHEQSELEPAQHQQHAQPTSSDDSNFSYAGSSRHATPTATNNNTISSSKSRFDATEDDDSNSYSDYPYGGNGGGGGGGSGTGTENSNGPPAATYTPSRSGHAHAAVAKRAFPAFATSHTSTPIRSATAASGSAAFADTPKLPYTPQNFKILKRRESSLSSSYQNDDSMCSMSSASLQNNSFFAAEHDGELQQRRLDKALETIAVHLAKPLLDPFNSELCKALLTKIGFPSREHSDTYKMVSQPINKLANARLAMLANIPFQIEREVGRGSYGSVYRATNANTGATVALKYQKPANNWELYICTEVHRRVTDPHMVAGFMDISAGIVAPNASIIVSEFSPFGSLLDINNRIRQNTKKVMHETLVMHFSMEILSIVDHLHACKIIHADIKPDNFLLMKIPDSHSQMPSVRLIDFGCAIDMKCFDENTQFMKRIETDGFTCIEMQEGRPWSYQTDIFCIAGTIHVMLLGEYMQPVKRFGQWELKNKLPRYLKKDYWLELFSTFLNMTDADHLPNLLAMKEKIGDELYKKESELQSQIRTLSNILHKR